MDFKAKIGRSAEKHHVFGNIWSLVRHAIRHQLSQGHEHLIKFDSRHNTVTINEILYRYSFKRPDGSKTKEWTSVEYHEALNSVGKNGKRWKVIIKRYR